MNTSAAAMQPDASLAGREILEYSTQSGGAALIDGIAGEWRDLCREGASDEPFFRPEWVAAYLHAFAPDAHVLLFTARANGRLRAVLPLVRRFAVFSGVPARILESPSNVHSVRFDLVRGRGDGEAAVAAIWKALKAEHDWDVIVLKDVPAGGAAEHLLRLAESERWPVGRWDTDHTPIVPMIGVTDPLALVTHGHFRANIRRRRRKATSAWPLSLQRTESADAHALEEFYALEASGWKGRTGTAIAGSPATRSFYDEVAGSAAAFGYLAVYLLRFGGIPVAGFFGLFYNRHCYTPKIGFDEQYAAFSPGHLLVEAVLRDSMTRGIVEFDFLGPSMPWKLQWTSAVRPHAHCYIFRKTAIGRALHFSRCELMARARPLVHKGRALFSRGARP